MIPATKSAAWSRNRIIRDGIYRAIYERMKADRSIYLFGEGAHMKIHFDAPNIEKEFGDRVFTLPISEDANTNFAVGASLLGVKPIVDVISSDFLFRTMDSICNTAAKLNYTSADIDTQKSIVVRSEFFLGGPTTGQRIESLFTHIPGLRVALPSNPRDAHGLMRCALETPGITIFFEDRMVSDSGFAPGDLSFPDAEVIPFGSARKAREGDGLTIVSYAISLRELENIARSNSIDCDLIDLRSLYPVDYDMIHASVKKTGRLLIVEPDVQYAGIGAEIAANVSEHCFSYLKKPIRRLGSSRSILPASLGLHKDVLPSSESILKHIKEMAS